MRFAVAAAALAAALLATACDRPPLPRTEPAAGSGPSAPAQPSLPQTGAPSMGQKKEGANPVQGQVDPKQSEQHKDFQQRGDGAGPTSPETQPKN
jgi:hypothetical protein